MTETVNNSDSSTAPAGGAAAGDTSAPNTGGGPSGAPAGAGAGEGGSEPTKKTQKGSVEAAAARAAQRKAAVDKPSVPNSSTTVGGAPNNAPGGSAPAAAGPTGADAGNGGTATAGAGTDDASAPGSTVKAPDDWSAQARAAFDGLPNDDARSQLLGMYQDMHRQFTESQQSMAQLRGGYEALHKEFESGNYTPADAQRLIKLDSQFNSDPKGVIQHLAQQAGMEVWFERPLAAGEIPKFDNEAQLAEWVRNQTLEQVRAERDAAERKAKDDAELQRHRDDLSRQLEEASKKHGERFGTQRTAVFDRLVQPLSIEDAFALVTLPELRAQAERATQLAADLAKAHSELEATRKRASGSVQGAVGGEQSGEDLSKLSPVERAARRATARKAAAP